MAIALPSTFSPTRIAVLGPDGRTLVARCRVADTAPARLRGLLGRTSLDDGEGLWLTPCRGVHTLGMRMPIACALVGPAGEVLELRDPLPPWRTLSARRARSALECRPGALAGLVAGDRLCLRPE